jgi:hypothetical protein
MSFDDEEIRAFQKAVEDERERKRKRVPLLEAEVKEWARKYASAVKGGDPGALPPILEELWSVLSVRDDPAALSKMVQCLPPADDDRFKITLTSIALANKSELLLRLFAERDLLFVDYDDMVASLSAEDTSMASLHWSAYRSLCQRATGKRTSVLGDLCSDLGILPVLGIEEEEDVPELEPDESERPAKRLKTTDGETRTINIRVRANVGQFEALKAALEGKFY